MGEEKSIDMRKHSARATQAKMDLHDLSEELPLGWERIMEQAQKTYDAFAALAAAKSEAAVLAPAKASS